MKKGQLDFPIFTIIAVTFVIVIYLIFGLKVLNSVKDPISNAFGNMSGGSVAQAGANQVSNFGINSMDKIFAVLFIFMIIGLLLSVFFIDTHPIWIFLFIILGVMAILFGNVIQYIMSTIMGSSAFTQEQLKMPFTSFIINNFEVVLVGIIILVLLVLYGKFGLNRGASNR